MKPFRNFYIQSLKPLFERVEELRGYSPEDIFEIVDSDFICESECGRISQKQILLTEVSTVSDVEDDFDSENEEIEIEIDDTYNVSDIVKKIGSPFGMKNKKVHAAIFNMTTATNCPSYARNLCFTRDACYARRQEAQYPDAVKKRVRQKIYWENCTPEEFVNDFTEINRKKRLKIQYMRINEAGDIRNQEDITKLNKITTLFRSSEFPIDIYAYTARADLNFKGAKFVVRGSGYPKLTKNGHCVVYDKDLFPNGLQGLTKEKDGIAHKYINCPASGCGKSCFICLKPGPSNVAFKAHSRDLVLDKLVGERYLPVIYGTTEFEGDEEDVPKIPILSFGIEGTINGKPFVIVSNPKTNDLITFKPMTKFRKEKLASGETVFVPKGQEMKNALMFSSKEWVENRLEDIKKMIKKPSNIKQKDFEDFLNTLTIMDYSEYKKDIIKKRTERVEKQAENYEAQVEKLISSMKGDE